MTTHPERELVHAMLADARHQIKVEDHSMRTFAEVLLEEAANMFRETYGTDPENNLSLMLMHLASEEAERLLAEYRRHGTVGRA